MNHQRPTAFLQGGIPLNNETGSTLVIALFVLVILSLIGISASRNTVIETQIARNDRNYKTAFHNGDAGIYTIPKLISESIDMKATYKLDNPAPFVYLDEGDDDDGPDSTFYRKLSGFAESDEDPDVRFSLDGDNNINVSVERLRSMSIVGGGAMFGEGAAGAGSNMQGILYGLDSGGEGPGNSRSNISATYLKVLRISGGL